MYIVIVGAGGVGSYLARMLSGEGHEVAVVEIDEELAQSLDNSLNALVVHGSGVSPAALRHAGIDRADLLLAVTAFDEVNLIACMTGRKHGSARLRAIARVRQSRHVAGDLALSAEDLGLDALVSPEQAIADSALNVLRYPGGGEMRELANGKLALVAMVPGADSPLVHETLAELRLDFPGEFLVVAVQGGDGIRIPSGADRVAVDERAYILTLPANLTELAILSGQPWYHVQRVLIVGCGNTGLALARELDRRNLSPMIIEQDQARAELVAGLLPRSLVVHGDGSDPKLLRSRIEEGRIDAVVVLLEEAEKSVLIGIFAKSLGARKVVVRCDEEGYISLANRLGVDAALSSKRAMTDAILAFVRKGSVRSALLLGEHEAEIVQFRVPDAPVPSDLVGRPLREFVFPKGSMIGAIVRDEQVLLASGQMLLQPGDELLVVCRPEAVGAIEKLLSTRK